MALNMTYDFTTNREDLSDVVDVLVQDDTPLYTGLQKKKATNTTHEWVVRGLTTASANAQVEGFTYSYTAHTAPTRVSNYCQIFAKMVQVSLSQIASNPAGYKDDFKNEVKMKLIEIKTDIENAMITATGDSGTTASARKLKGFLPAITTNIETGTATSGNAFSETMFNDLLQTIWAAGGRPKDAYANGFNKRAISAFSTSNTRNINVAAGKIANYVSVYESDFGVINIHLEPFMTTSKVLLLDKSRAAVAVFRPLAFSETSKTASAMNGVIEGELTIEYGSEGAHGQAIYLTTT